MYDSDSESRIAILTDWLNNELRAKLLELLKHSKENTLNTIDYLQSVKNEINPSLSYQVVVIRVLIIILLHEIYFTTSFKLRYLVLK